MTQTRALTAVALAAAVLAGVATALLLLVASQPQAHAAGVAPMAQLHRIAAIPAPAVQADELVATAMGGETDYTTVAAQEIHLAADRVCEGFTAQVPVVVMEQELAAEFQLDGQTAHQFVTDAHRLQCPLA